MKQNMVIKLDHTLQRTFHKEMKDSLDVLRYNKADLETFLSQVSSKNPYLIYRANADDQKLDLEAFSSHKESLSDVIQLQNHLLEDPVNADLVSFLLSRLDSNGYFKEDLLHLEKESLFSRAQLEEGIQKLSCLEPVGCFSFSLKDCLAKQCKESLLAASETGIILCDYLYEVADKRWDIIAQKTDLTFEEIEEGVRFLRSLNPKPAANYANDSMALIPEAKIIVENKQIKVNLLQQDFQLTIADIESNIASKAMLELRKEAKNIWNQVQKRYLTILQILQILCEIQSDFFLFHEPMHPCTMSDVAKRCHLHVSTISRAIQGKSFEFENHYYPIKVLFSHSGTKKLSEQAIVDLLLKKIEQEDQDHPYSDAKLQSFLELKGITVSRRAIAKYRQDHGIPSSTQRKRLNILKLGE